MRKSLYINKIKFYCSKRNITLKQLAEDAGISETGLHQMLNRKSMRVETLINIAEVLEVSVCDLLVDDDKEARYTVDQFMNALQEVISKQL